MSHNRIRLSFKKETVHVYINTASFVNDWKFANWSLSSQSPQIILARAYCRISQNLWQAKVFLITSNKTIFHIRCLVVNKPFFLTNQMLNAKILLLSSAKRGLRESLSPHRVVDGQACRQLLATDPGFHWIRLEIKFENFNDSTVFLPLLVSKLN